MKITPTLLVDATGCSAQRALFWAKHIDIACHAASINTPKRVAYFLGQVAHESGRFRYVREIWGPTRTQLRYEGRHDLGNVIPGDGKRYMGRGLIQITGRANYAQFTKRMQAIDSNAPDFVVAPLLLEDPHWAAMSAADYWMTRHLNVYADKGDLFTLTKRVNGGTNGLADRQTITTAALAALNSMEATYG